MLIIISQKIHKNIKYLELKNSNQNITGYKNIKINTKINKILHNVHTKCPSRKNTTLHPYCGKCNIYGKNGSEPICHDIVINKKYNIDYDREIHVKSVKSRTIGIGKGDVIYGLNNNN